MRPPAGRSASSDASATPRASRSRRRWSRQRIAGEIDDTLLFVEHPPVITLGVRTRGATTNVRADADALAAQGVEVHETGRGGDVTFHGPGQLVGYPIIDLKPDRQDVHRYVRDLEEVLIRTAADFGIAADRVKGFSGAWVGDAKLAAIGVRISRWVTSHGFALNVTTDLVGLRPDRALRDHRSRRHVAVRTARPGGGHGRCRGGRGDAFRRGLRSRDRRLNRFVALECLGAMRARRHCGSRFECRPPQPPHAASRFATICVSPRAISTRRWIER